MFQNCSPISRWKPAPVWVVPCLGCHSVFVPYQLLLKEFLHLTSTLTPQPLCSCPGVHLSGAMGHWIGEKISNTVQFNPFFVLSYLQLSFYFLLYLVMGIDGWLSVESLGPNKSPQWAISYQSLHLFPSWILHQLWVPGPATSIDLCSITRLATPRVRPSRRH